MLQSFIRLLKFSNDDVMKLLHLMLINIYWRILASHLMSDCGNDSNQENVILGVYIIL